MKKLSRRIEPLAKAARKTPVAADRRSTDANDGAPLPLALGASVRVTNSKCNHMVACVFEASRKTNLAPFFKVAKRCMEDVAINRAGNMESAA